MSILFASGVCKHVEQTQDLPSDLIRFFNIYVLFADEQSLDFSVTVWYLSTIRPLR